MGLFNLLGASSPMFIPTNEKVEGFNIDYDKLAPALPKQQQAPGLAQNDYSKIDWTPGDIAAQQQRESQAKQYLQQAYNKSGGNFATLGNNPDFKQAQALMSINPLEAAQRDENKKMLDETKKDWSDKSNPAGRAIDEDYFNLTGQIRTMSQTLEEAYKTPSDQRNATYNPLDSVTKYGSQTIGTQKDLNEGIDKLLNEKTGHTTEELKSFQNEYFDKDGNIIPGKRDSLKTVGAHYGLIETLLSKDTNKQQLDDAADLIKDGMDDKMRFAINNDFIKKTGLKTDFSQYGDKAKDVEAIYNKFLVDTIAGYIKPREVSTYKKEQTMQSIGDLYADQLAKKKLDVLTKLDTGAWYATIPEVGKNGDITTKAPPTGHLDKIPVHIKDADGNNVIRYVTGNFPYFKGTQYDYDYGKQGKSIETLTRGTGEGTGDEVYFAGHWQPVSNFSGLKVQKQDEVTILPNQSRLTYEDFDNDGNLKESSRDKISLDHTVESEVVIPKDEINEYADKIEVSNYDKKDGKVVYEPMLNSWLHRLVPKTDKFSNNSSEDGLISIGADGNYHIRVKLRTPNAGDLHAKDVSAEGKKMGDNKFYTDILSGNETGQ